ncbi:hypothetical protein CLMAG_57850 [Clostridium magnum DSM 2767]|uniref:Uncharacterized protein n=1 Tax=Clostridium magnum DSM 2767 TaxID=1121326 RepID=A0A162QRU9_9CLOT|nr:hypothetical protein CLMAG_57850 [Clostridium magnum DSM 2767]
MFGKSSLTDKEKKEAQKLIKKLRKKSSIRIKSIKSY